MSVSTIRQFCEWAKPTLCRFSSVATASGYRIVVAGGFVNHFSVEWPGNGRYDTDAVAFHLQNADSLTMKIYLLQWVLRCLYSEIESAVNTT